MSVKWIATDADNNGIWHVSSTPTAYGDIATVWTNPEENARLLAAAPDMLAALKAVIDPDNAPLILCTDAWGQKLLEDIGTAIAKAEGRDL